LKHEKLARKRARAGDLRAMVALGEAYQRGWDWPESEARARRWFAKAASRKDPDALLSLAWLYRAWREAPLKLTRRRERQGDRWLREAAAYGSADAQHMVAQELLEVNDTDPAGLAWLHRAAEGGHARAMEELAACYELGRGLAADRVEALKWLRLARRHGEYEVQDRLCALKERLSPEERLSAQERLLDWVRRRSHVRAESREAALLATDGYQVIEAHERGLAKIMEAVQHLPFLPLRTFAEAVAAPDGVIIAEGDYGGQIYFTCPARLVRCSEAELLQLLEEVDATQWDSVLEGGARIYYERLPVGAGVAGGMGGGEIVEGVWMHEDLIDLGDDEAVLAVLEGRARFFRPWTLEETEALATRGDARAMYRLVEWARDGRQGMPKDPAIAMAWLKRAAALGHVGAQWGLVSVYESGEDGGEPDPSEEVRWLLALAEADLPPRRQWMLGRLARRYATGTGVPQDGAEAMRLYAMSVRWPEDYMDMGWRYLRGDLVPADPDEAVRWFEWVSVEYSHGPAQHALGLLCLNGWGRPRDRARALGYFQQAAEQEHGGAMLRLAWFFAKGIAGPIDEAEALHWALRAEDTQTRHAACMVASLKHRLGPHQSRQAEKRLEALWMPKRR
jgi:TPR repeat protein